jgi:copper chaperone CopZ
MLWFAAALTLAFAAFPKYAGHFIGGNAPAAALGEVSGTTLELNIQGMTCEACASGLQETLRRVPGVRFAAVDYRSHTARLVVDPEQMRVVQDTALSSIQESGYQVTLPATTSK